MYNINALKDRKISILLIAIGIPLLVGNISALLSGNVSSNYLQLNRPPLSPPGILFPIVWTILYALMGIASYIVYTQDKTSNALKLYALQLFVNFMWSIIFFRQEMYLFAFIWLVLLWLLIIITIKAFYKISPLAAKLLIPYLLWVTFAGYLNLVYALLSRIFSIFLFFTHDSFR